MNWVDSWSGRMTNDGGRAKQPNLHEISEETFQQFLAQHPNGASVQEVATCMGLTRERVTQIINRSLVKLQRACERRGVTMDDCPSHRESTWDRIASG